MVIYSNNRIITKKVTKLKRLFCGFSLYSKLKRLGILKGKISNIDAENQTNWYS